MECRGSDGAYFGSHGNAPCPCSGVTWSGGPPGGRRHETGAATNPSDGRGTLQADRSLHTTNAFEIAAMMVGIMEESMMAGATPSQAELLELEAAREVRVLVGIYRRRGHAS